MKVRILWGCTRPQRNKNTCLEHVSQQPPTGNTALPANGAWGPRLGTQHHDPQGPEPALRVSPVQLTQSQADLETEPLKRPHSSLIALGRLSREWTWSRQGQCQDPGSLSQNRSCALNPMARQGAQTPTPSSCATTAFKLTVTTCCLLLTYFYFSLSFQPPRWPGVWQRIREGKTPSAVTNCPGQVPVVEQGQWPRPATTGCSALHPQFHHLLQPLSLAPEKNPLPETVRLGEAEETQTLRGPPDAAPAGAACVLFSPSLATAADAGAASSLHPTQRNRSV